MKRTFINSELFTRQTTGVLTEEALRIVQLEIMQGQGKTIPGTNGLQKIRCRGDGRGKRSGWRIVFADYPAYGITVLLVGFPKNVKENLSPEETNELKRIKKQMDLTMEMKYGSKKAK